MIRITDIIDKIIENDSDADVSLVDKAYIYSARVHDGQMRLSGEPYLTHPLEVAGILADMNLDCMSIAAGLLHDVIEDTHATPEEIGEMFGDDVRHIVDGVTKLSKLDGGSSEERHAESLRKMILAMADDIRVILVKLADRLHNMRTLKYHLKESKKREISQETLDIYAPLASRLGIYWIRKELENTAFMYLMPEEYERIRDLTSKHSEEREHYIETVKSFIKAKMEEAELGCDVLGRYKHVYSIYQKMKKQHLEFENVYDIIAFRIILETRNPRECYTAMALVHSLWRPIDTKTKMYIGKNAKSNGYESIHTTVIGPYGERIEIQIRTKDMDIVARSGIAAHWKYKEGKPADSHIREKFVWIHNLIENQKSIKDPKELLKNVRLDLLTEEISVFTPNGDVKTLPKGASPIDFAYLIHSEVGSQCTGAKVNGRMVPLRSELQNGDVVSIITSKGQHPSRDWLSFVKTVKAKNRIRQWIKAEDKARSISLGKEMCEKSFRKYRLNFNAVAKSEDMKDILGQFGLKTTDDLLANVGYGKITPLQIVRKFLPSAQEHPEHDAESVSDKKPISGSGIVVTGVKDILLRFGKCCQPLPGDEITGYITLGQGVTVHRSTCANLMQMNPERLVDVQWSESEEVTYPVNIRIRSHDKVELMADLTRYIGKHGVNILKINAEVCPDNTVDATMTLAVRDADHLNRIISAIRNIKEIIEVIRLDS